jgi:hypothetical protein
MIVLDTIYNDDDTAATSSLLTTTTHALSTANCPRDVTGMFF